MTTKHELADGIPYQFPFVAMLRGQSIQHRRTDIPVIVHGYSGMERNILRIELAGNHYTVASDSMLYVEGVI